MLAPATLSTTAPVWPIPNDVANLQAIVWAQMLTISQQEALLHAYQVDLNNVQAVAPATATGTVSPSPGTTLTTSGTVGSILLGAVISGAGVPTSPAPTVIAQQSGSSGGNGVYVISAPLTLNAVLLTFSPGGGSSKWPVSTAASDLMLITQGQTAVIRTQTALLQQYQDLLNNSEVAAPATGP